MKKAVNKILHWYFSRNALPYWCVLLLDMLTMLVAGIFTYWIFIYKRHVTVDVIMLGRTLCMYVLPILVGARMFHTYSGIVRYSSFIDLLHIAYANIVSLIVAYAWHHFVWSIPTTVFYHLHFRHIVLMYIIGTALMWSTRLLVKSLYEVLTTDANTLRTFIYGVKEGGVGLAKNISSLPTKQFAVKGFISPEEVSSNVRLMGERIYNIDDRLETAIRKARIKAVLVPSLMIDSFRNNIELQDLLLAAGVKIYMARQAQEMDSGREDGAKGHERSWFQSARGQRGGLVAARPDSCRHEVRTTAAEWASRADNGLCWLHRFGIGAPDSSV